MFRKKCENNIAVSNSNELDECVIVSGVLETISVDLAKLYINGEIVNVALILHFLVELPYPEHETAMKPPPDGESHTHIKLDKVEI